VRQPGLDFGAGEDLVRQKSTDLKVGHYRDERIGYISAAVETGKKSG